MILNFMTDRSGQAVRTQIRRLLFHLHVFDKLPSGFPYVESPWTQWTFSMAIVQLEYCNEWTGQCPWTMSTESMGNVHGLSGHCPWTQWTWSMDSVNIFHGLSGQFPWTQWTLSSQFLGFSPTLYIGLRIVKECKYVQFTMHFIFI